MVVFLVCGMWHGAGMNFLAWGLLHGIYSVVGSLIRERNKNVAEGHAGKKKTGLRRIATFFLVTFAWIFFRSGSLRSALLYIYQMATAGFWPGRWAQVAESLNLNGMEFGIVGIGMMCIGLVDRLCVQEKMHLPMIIQQKTNGIRYLVFYLLLITIFIFGIYGAGYYTEQFIYMQF